MKTGYFFKRDVPEKECDIHARYNGLALLDLTRKFPQSVQVTDQYYCFTGSNPAIGDGQTVSSPNGSYYEWYQSYQAKKAAEKAARAAASSRSSQKKKKSSTKTNTNSDNSSNGNNNSATTQSAQSWWGDFWKEIS